MSTEMNATPNERPAWEELSNAVRDVLAERLRQVNTEGYTPDHDDEHGDGTLAVAAAFLATAHCGYEHGRIVWPWDEASCKVSPTARSNIVKAAALLIAELERIDRALGTAPATALCPHQTLNGNIAPGRTAISMNSLQSEAIALQTLSNFKAYNVPAGKTLDWATVHKQIAKCPPGDIQHQASELVRAGYAQGMADTGVLHTSAPMFWVRLVGEDGGYEGPVHSKEDGGMPLQVGKPHEWFPLYLGATPAAAPDARPAKPPAHGAKPQDVAAAPRELQRILAAFARIALMGEPSEALMHQIERLIEHYGDDRFAEQLRTIADNARNPGRGSKIRLVPSASSAGKSEAALLACTKAWLQAPDDDNLNATAQRIVAFGALQKAMAASESALASAQASTAPGKLLAPFQHRVQPWLQLCFGEMIAGDREERNHRFLEESLELVQSLGCSASEAHQLVDYVYGRPLGEPNQEVGGVMVTLAALCLANGLDMHENGETELQRISEPSMVLKIRAKQAAKPKYSPLPVAPAAQGQDATMDAGPEGRPAALGAGAA